MSDFSPKNFLPAALSRMANLDPIRFQNKRILQTSFSYFDACVLLAIDRAGWLGQPGGKLTESHL
jgi:hypothetical protein